MKRASKGQHRCGQLRVTDQTMANSEISAEWWGPIRGIRGSREADASRGCTVASASFHSARCNRCGEPPCARMCEPISDRVLCAIISLVVETHVSGWPCSTQARFCGQLEHMYIYIYISSITEDYNGEIIRDLYESQWFIGSFHQSKVSFRIDFMRYFTVFFDSWFVEGI